MTRVPGLVCGIAAAMVAACSSSSFAVAEPRGGDDAGGEPGADAADVGGRSDTTVGGSDTTPPGAETSGKDAIAGDLGTGDGIVGEVIAADTSPLLDGTVLPTIVIDHPGDSACWVSPGTQTIRVTVTGWTLADLGTCAGTPRCGPAYVTIDGTDCNLTGLSYNTIIGASGSSDLVLTSCKKGRDGSKQIQAELHNDDGSVFMPNVSAMKTTDFTGPC